MGNILGSIDRMVPLRQLVRRVYRNESNVGLTLERV